MQAHRKGVGLRIDRRHPALGTSGCTCEASGVLAAKIDTRAVRGSRTHDGTVAPGDVTVMQQSVLFLNAATSLVPCEGVAACHTGVLLRAAVQGVSRAGKKTIRIALHCQQYLLYCNLDSSKLAQ